MGNNPIKYLVFTTTNLVNGKTYTGIHETTTPDEFDGYLGHRADIKNPKSYNRGKAPLHVAILKYGVSSFRRKTLKVFDNLKDAVNFISTIVSDEFIKQPDNYNDIAFRFYSADNRKLYQFNLNGALVKIWNSISAIEEYYGCTVDIESIIKDKSRFAGSYWSFNTTIKHLPKDEQGWIYQYNTEGVLLHKFENATIAAKQLDIDRQAIFSSIFKKKRYSGYYFLRYNMDIAEAISPVYKKQVGRQFIYRYKETGEFDKAYPTPAKAVNDTPKSHTLALKKALIHGMLCGGYRWSYIKADNYFDVEKPFAQKKVKVGQYTKDGELIKVYESINQCKKDFPNCFEVCKGLQEEDGGFVFKFMD